MKKKCDFRYLSEYCHNANRLGYFCDNKTLQNCHEFKQKDNMETMTFAEACLKMRPGDTFQPNFGYGNPIKVCADGSFDIQDGSKHTSKLIDLEWMKAKGHIIPAEPKVMTAEERIDIDFKFWEDRSNWGIKDIFTGGFVKGEHYGKEQGRLERDLELRPLIEAVERFVNVYWPNTTMNDHNSLEKAFKNIPPLNKDEK